MDWQCTLFFKISSEYALTYCHMQVIVQGRYDVVCPPVSAFDLKKALPHAEMVVTLTGHSATEHEIIEKLVQATEKFRKSK